MSHDRRLLLIGAAIALAAFAFQMALQNAMRPHAIRGIYFQGWSSETLTQTVPIEALREAPLQSILNIHIEPPGFDLLRAVLLSLSPSADIGTALKEVDMRLMVVWALAYSVTAGVVFAWTAQLTRTWVGVLVASIFALHPGSIFYVTLLDPTMITTLLITAAFYLLWRAKKGSAGAVPALTVVALCLFLTKSFFQAPLILLLGTSLYLLKVPRGQLRLFLLIAGGVALLYGAKQYYQFRIFHTSSFAAYNLCKSIGIDNNYTVKLDLEARDVTGLPSVLARQSKLSGGINYNNINYLDFSDYLMKKYLKYMLKFPVAELQHQYRHNLMLYWLPSSHYGNEVNVIVERLPYRVLFDAVFSYPVFTTILLLCGAYAVWKAISGGDVPGAAALLLPALAIFTITVIGDKGENMRYKYFLEPVYIIFVVWAINQIISTISARWRPLWPGRGNTHAT